MNLGHTNDMFQLIDTLPLKMTRSQKVQPPITVEDKLCWSNPTTTFTTPSLRRKPESSQYDLEYGSFSSWS